MGLCLLALAVLWPGLKSHLPGRRQTDHERLDNIEAERIPMRLYLGGHLKTGHRGSPQNRPTGRSQDMRLLYRVGGRRGKKFLI